MLPPAGHRKQVQRVVYFCESLKHVHICEIMGFTSCIVYNCDYFFIHLFFLNRSLSSVLILQDK